MIYLDYNATAPVRPSILEAWAALSGLPLNPSSAHRAGRQANKLVEDARASIASHLGAFANEVVFCGSATEANNQVLRAFATTHRLLVSAIEHPSIAKTASLLGASVLPVDGQGLVKVDLLAAQLAALDGQPALVSVMLANNETGVIQPLAEIATLCKTYGALLHTDAVQALGKMPLDWGLLGADMMTLSAHKAGGRVGAAALLIRNDLPIKPLLTGGGQELGRRAGTENVAAIAAFGQVVAEVAAAPQAQAWAGWRDQLADQLLAACPQAVVFGTEAARLPNTLQIAMPGVSSETQLMHFDLAGFAVSAGSACSSGRIEPSPVLLAMGVAPELAKTAIRLSFGWQTTQDELASFAACWIQLATRLAKAA